MDTENILIQFSPEKLGQLLDLACDKTEGEALHILCDLVSFNTPVFVPVAIARKFLALEQE